MRNETAKRHIDDHLEPGDSVVGWFGGVSWPRLWVWFLLGPLAVLGLRQWFIAVSHRGVYFHRISLIAKPEGYDFFRYDEITECDVGRGYLNKPMRFLFNNNRRLKVRAQSRGLKHVPKLTPEVQEHLVQRVQRGH